MRCAVVIAIVVGSFASARADDDHAKADALFAEAQQLREAGKTADACKKYEEALRYNPNAVGTILNVGLCNEEAGKFASAVKLYAQARDLAREGGYAEHQKAAEERIAAAQPFVARLAIAFAETPNQVKLVIDDQVIPIDKTDDIVIDPGSHHVVVTAPGRVPWETTVTVDKSAAKAIAVPKLGYPVTVKKGRRTVGIILTASGGAMIATGIGLGLYARHKYNSQIGPHCTTEDPPRCDSEGYRATNDARTFGTFGTIIGLGGIAVAGAGAYLWFFGPTPSAERNVAVVPSLTAESAGITAFGRF